MCGIEVRASDLFYSQYLVPRLTFHAMPVMSGSSWLFSLCCLAVACQALSAKEWEKQSIYSVMTDRFAKSTDEFMSTPCALKSYCGGTWQGIIEQLDYIQDMGFTAVSSSWHAAWESGCSFACLRDPDRLKIDMDLTSCQKYRAHRHFRVREAPMSLILSVLEKHCYSHRLNKKYSAPYHGYWTADIWCLNDHFGSEDDLMNLADELHSRGMVSSWL